MKRIEENQIEYQKQNSKFYIVECVKEMDGSLKCNNVIVLENKDHPKTIKLNNNYYYFVTNCSGNIIHAINKKSQREEREIVSCTVNYVDQNKLVITSQTYNDEPTETTYISYHPRNLVKRNLFDYRKGGRLLGIEIPNEKKDTIIIKRYNKKIKEADSRLFSVKKGKFISPSFTNIYQTKETGKDILRFDDEVYSNKEVDKRRYMTTLTGFITLDGVIGNQVYDSDLNRPRDIGLKSGKLMEAYKMFRNRVKLELDYKFEEEKQVERRKKKFRENSIFQLGKRVKRDSDD